MDYNQDYNHFLTLFDVIAVDFLPIFFQHYTFFSHDFPTRFKTRQTKHNTLYTVYIPTGLQTPDLQLVLLSNSRPPTVTTYLLEPFYTRRGLFIMLPQDESSLEVPLSSLAGRVERGLRPLLSSKINISST